MHALANPAMSSEVGLKVLDERVQKRARLVDERDCQVAAGIRRTGFENGLQ